MTGKQKVRAALIRIGGNIGGILLGAAWIMVLLGAWHSLRPAIPPVGYVECLVALVLLRIAAANLADGAKRAWRSDD